MLGVTVHHGTGQGWEGKTQPRTGPELRVLPLPYSVTTHECAGHAALPRELWKELLREGLLHVFLGVAPSRKDSNHSLPLIYSVFKNKTNKKTQRT